MTEFNPRPEYIGDSVYVDRWECGGVRIYTNNGMGPEDVIYLEPAVIRGLLRYVADMESEQEQSDGHS